MKATKIATSDVEQMKISSLPSRPTAPTAMGGRGYTAAEMKAAFDRLPLHLVEKYNDLLEDIASTEDGLTAAILTGISDGHSLADMLIDITDGSFASYLSLGSANLTDVIKGLEDTSKSQTNKITLLEKVVNDDVIECGRCSYRNNAGGFK